MKFRAKFISSLGKDLGTTGEMEFDRATEAPKVILVEQGNGKPGAQDYVCFRRMERVRADVWAYHETPAMILNRNVAAPTVQ